MTLAAATDTSSTAFAFAETPVDTTVVSNSASEGIVKAGTSGVPRVEAASATSYRLPYEGEQKQTGYDASKGANSGHDHTHK